MKRATPAPAPRPIRPVLLALATAILFAAPAPAHASSAAELGKAWKAFESGNYRQALRHAEAIRPGSLRNDDYRLYVVAESHALLGECRLAVPAFRDLSRKRGSRFAEVARWRMVDCQWQAGDFSDAQKGYRGLLRGKRDRDLDTSLAEFRVAAADARLGRGAAAIRGLRRFLIEHPLHPAADDAQRLIASLGGSLDWSASERIERAQNLSSAKKWPEAIAELEKIGDDAGASAVKRRDYWLGMTLFRMRRQYERAGTILLGLYKDMGSEAARALFHGARALSRADRDKDAIRWYQRVVAEYPRSSWAAEAQYLSGWLEFNMGNYEAGIPHLERTQKLYGRSRWAREASWFLGMSHFLLGAYDAALPYFDKLSKRGDRLEGGKGEYWAARSRQLQKKKAEAEAGYRRVVDRFPFSWYALLAHARLREMGVTIGPFGDSPADPSRAPDIDDDVDPRLASDPLIADADELLAAGLPVFAGSVLRSGESGFLKRHGREKGIPMLLDRYRKAENWNRPWMMGIVYGGSRALNAPPKGDARQWWEYAYPRAYQALVEKHRGIGDNPPNWLYSIMHKESGFDPHVHSYADARGLLQMIPATTKRVATALDLSYSEDLLFDPEANIKTGSWYIGKLFHKFREQVPMAAGSFNSGPRPVMRWLDQNKGRPTDEWVELVSYTQTREYMKKVTEIYARYLYLYDGTVYEQPLTVNSDYRQDDVTY